MQPIFFNYEYEKSIIGSVLQKPLILSKEIVEQSFNPGFFHSEPNRLIFFTISQLYNSGVEPDIMSVTQRLLADNNLDKAGGAAYIAELSACSNVANVSFYLSEVKKLWEKRKLYSFLQEGQKALKDGAGAQEITDNLNDALINLQIASDPTNSEMSLTEIVETFKKDCDKKRELNQEYIGVPTGFQTYDKVTSGLQEEEYIIIAARPSMGKTALAVSMINNMIERGVPVALFSLEMSATQIIQRFLAIQTETNLYHLRNGLKDNDKYAKIFNEATLNHFLSLPLKLIDETNINIKTLKAKARYLKKVFDIKIIFIDYIGLIDSGMPNAKVFEQQSYISKELKKLAKELKIPVVALCQVARDAEGKEPTLANLRGSGSIEQDADQVILIHGDRESDEPIVERTFLLAKNRNGACIRTSIDFVKAYTLYKEKED
jgi:replicative DNA helicase